MSYAQSQTVSVTTATGGTTTGYTEAVTGRIEAVKYIKDGSTPLASTADITITTEVSGQAVLTDANINATEIFHPVAACAKAADGSASTLTETKIYAANERVKIAVAQGGNTKTGSFIVVLS